jgi:hypothetical protein
MCHFYFFKAEFPDGRKKVNVEQEPSSHSGILLGAAISSWRNGFIAQT